MSKYGFMNQNKVPSVPATSPIPGREHEMVPNHEGGYGWNASGLTMLRRFLILGTTENQYYADKRELTTSALTAITGYLKENLDEAIREYREVVRFNRAISPSPAIYLLAYLFSMGIPRWTSAAKAMYPEVLRTGAHLQEFTSYVRAMKKTGRALRTSFEKWLEGKDDRTLMYQMLKYQQRHGFSWADMFALYHPRPKGDVRSTMYTWARFGGLPTAEFLSNGGKRMTMAAAEKVLAQAQEVWAKDPAFAQVRTMKKLIALGSEEIKELGAAPLVESIRDLRMTHEMVTGTEIFATHKAEGWSALAEKMPAHAMLRSLNTLSANGVLKGEIQANICKFLQDDEAIKRARVHPMSLLKTWYIYRGGKGLRGSLAWDPNPKVVAALERAFAISMRVKEPLKGRVLVALDVSGSMYHGAVPGMEFLAPYEVGSAYAHIMMRSCESPEVMYFDYRHSNAWGNRRVGGEEGYKIVTKELKGIPTLDKTIEFTRQFGAGGTDCSIPIAYALKHKKHFDLFVLFTDGESWAGNHGAAVVQEYRKQVNANARVVYCTTAPYGTVLTDPGDVRALDIVGFDPNAATLIEDFHRGNL